MRILITGNSGYVGSTLVGHLRRVMPTAEIIGYDAGFFAHCLTDAETLPVRTRPERPRIALSTSERLRVLAASAPPPPPAPDP